MDVTSTMTASIVFTNNLPWKLAVSGLAVSVDSHIQLQDPHIGAPSKRYLPGGENPCPSLPPHCTPQSDSGNLDNVTELLVMSGTPVEEALMALVPEAYRNHPDLVKNYPEVRERSSES